MANGLRSLAKAAISATAFFFLLFFLEGHPLLEEKERTIIDDLGQRVKLKGDVKRIVSLVPSNSELVCLLDCARLKGGTRFDRFPQELVQRIREKKTEVIGGGFDPSLEKIVEIGPDLVLTNGPTLKTLRGSEGIFCSWERFWIERPKPERSWKKRIRVSKRSREKRDRKELRRSIFKPGRTP